jgi:CRISPR-associated exonuclease Cas4
MVGPLVAMVFLLTIAFVLALLVWVHAGRRIARSGVPEGRAISQDADRRRALHRPLVSLRYGLAGKPDYLVETTEGLVPVELKSRDSPRSGPYASDTTQLTAYCVLVEAATGVTPPYGIIQYANRSWRIKYTPYAREQLLRVIEEMRGARHLQTVHRNHSCPGRCRACGFRETCGERIG